MLRVATSRCCITRYTFRSACFCSRTVFIDIGDSYLLAFVQHGKKPTFEHLHDCYLFAFVDIMVWAFAIFCFCCIRGPSICNIVVLLHSCSEHLQDCFLFCIRGPSICKIVFFHIRCCLAYKGSYLLALGLLELRRVLTYDEHLLNDIVWKMTKINDIVWTIFAQRYWWSETQSIHPRPNEAQPQCMLKQVPSNSYLHFVSWIPTNLALSLQSSNPQIWTFWKCTCLMQTWNHASHEAQDGAFCTHRENAKNDELCIHLFQRLTRTPKSFRCSKRNFELNAKKQFSCNIPADLFLKPVSSSPSKVSRRIPNVCLIIASNHQGLSKVT